MRSSRFVLGTLGALASALFVGVLSASAAIVAPSWAYNETGAAYTQTVSFVGQQQATPITGLNAAVILTLSEVTADQRTWSYDFEVQNNVVSPIHAAQIRYFSFAPAGSVVSIVTDEETESVGILGPKADADDGSIVCINTNQCKFEYDSAIKEHAIGSGSFTFTVADATPVMTLSDLKLGFSAIEVDPGATSLPIVGGWAVGSATSSVLTPGVVPSAAPEPSTWALMMIGVGGMGGALRARRRKTVAA